jgi:hypothetical protein
MSVKGTLKGSELVLGRVTVDWLKQPTMSVTALAAIVDPKTGTSHAWLDGAQVTWSKKTSDALEALRKSMESDMAKVHLVSGGATEGAADKDGLQMPEGGISEHLGTSGGDAPSI